MAERTVLTVELNTQQAFTSIKDIRKAIKDIKDQMAGMDAGSDAFRQAALRAGELQHQIDEIQQTVRGASTDFGDMLGNFTKVGAGLTGAFQAAQGAMSLMGSESEDVARAIEKMQSIMAMTQGLAAIDNGIKGFKKLATAIGLTSNSLSGFKKALISTGLGALVVVLGSIIANWDEFTEAIGLSEKQLNKFGEVVGGVMNVLKGSISSITQAITKAITGDFKGAWETIKGGFDVAELYAEGVQKTITEREEKELKEREKANLKYVEEQEKEYDRLASKVRATISDEKRQTEELIKIERERLKLYKEGSKEYYDELQKINSLQDKLKDKPKETKQDNKELEELQKSLDNLRKSYRDKLQVIEDSQREEESLLMVSREKGLLDEEEYQQRILEIEKKYSEERDKYSLGKIGEFKGEEIDETSSFESQLATLESNKQAELDLIQSYYDQGLLSKEAYEQQTLNIESKYAAESEKVQSQRIQKIGQAAVSVSNLLTNVLSSIADAQDQSTKEGFEKSKKLQIAAATIQTISGVATALAGAFTTKTGPWDIAIAAVQAATIAASGAAQIAKISRTKFDGGGASVGSVSANLSSSASSLSSPVQYTQDIQGQDFTQAMKDVKVYVSETDITSTQKKIKVAESESRY